MSRTLAGPRIGVHVSVAGGLENAFTNAVAAGCDCIQIFVKNQRQWRARPLRDEQVRAFLAARAKSTVQPILAHASYLLNLASSNEAVRQKTKDSMVDELIRCETLGVEALVFHPGAYLDIDIGVVRDAAHRARLEEQAFLQRALANQSGDRGDQPGFDRFV